MYICTLRDSQTCFVTLIKTRVDILAVDILDVGNLDGNILTVGNLSVGKKYTTIMVTRLVEFSQIGRLFT
jgi:hypothetical protein